MVGVADDDDEKARHSSSVSNDIWSKDPKGGELRGVRDQMRTSRKQQME